MKSSVICDIFLSQLHKGVIPKVDASHSFETCFKRATSPLAVLHFLKDRLMFGYEISQAMKEASGGHFTLWGAYASFEEGRKGTIAPGMLADFVILGENVFDIPANRIKDVPVLATYLGGEKIYCR